MRLDSKSWWRCDKRCLFCDCSVICHIVGLWLVLLKVNSPWRGLVNDLLYWWWLVSDLLNWLVVDLFVCLYIYRLLPRRALKVTMSSKSTPYIPVHICTFYLWCKSANSWIRCYFLITSRVFWSYPSFSHRVISLIPKITRFKFFFYPRLPDSMLSSPTTLTTFTLQSVLLY